MQLILSSGFVATVVTGFAFGIGFAVATWLVGLLLGGIRSKS